MTDICALTSQLSHFQSSTIATLQEQASNPSLDQITGLCSHKVTKAKGHAPAWDFLPRFYRDWGISRINIQDLYLNQASGEACSLFSISMGITINCITDLKTAPIITPFVFLTNVDGTGPRHPWKLYFCTGVRQRRQALLYYIIPTVKYQIAQQLWVATEILQGQDSLSRSISSTMLNLKHQESLSSQQSTHESWSKNILETLGSYILKDTENKPKKGTEFCKIAYKYTSLETSAGKASIRVLWMTVVYERSISLFQFPKTF